ncbi:hypothetical protein ACFWN2_15970 [Lentzea sp. NPDC058436]|uniref:hypothetical protein n=1 Tax=Lentzea sp. NPDC058436 TaxID=3346499 RepID=UPI0036487E41
MSGQQDLESAGFPALVRVEGDRLKIRIERAGQTAYSLDIVKGGGHYDGQLIFSPAGGWSGSSGSMIANAEPFFDAQSGGPKLRVFDLSLLDGFLGSGVQVLTKEEFFHRLWARIVEHLERA